MNIQSLSKSESIPLDGRFGTHIYFWTNRQTGKQYWLKVWAYITYQRLNIDTAHLVREETKFFRQMANTKLALNFPKIVEVKLNYDLQIDNNKARVHIQVFEPLTYNRTIFELRDKMSEDVIRTTFKKIVEFMKTLHDLGRTLLEWSTTHMFLDDECNPIFFNCYHAEPLSCHYNYANQLTLGISQQLRCPQWSSHNVNLVSSDSFQLGLLLFYLYKGVTVVQSNSARDDLYRLLYLSRYDFKQKIEKSKKTEKAHQISSATWKLIFGLIDPCDKMRLRPEEIELTDWWRESQTALSALAVKKANERCHQQLQLNLKLAKEAEQRRMRFFGRPKPEKTEGTCGGNRGDRGNPVPTVSTISKCNLMNCFFMPCAIEECKQVLVQKLEKYGMKIDDGDRDYTLLAGYECPSFILLLSFYRFEEDDFDLTVVKYEVTDGQLLQCHEVVSDMIRQITNDYQLIQ